MSEERESTPWRDNIEAMTMAIVMALLLKSFIVEAYKIPTGSMQPTLIGDERAEIEDRILVDKLSYVMGDPERWDVAVFRYPLNQAQNFVKRIVGVGPEDFKIESGDLWRRSDSSQSWEILRRPEKVQRDVWKQLDIEEPMQSSWRAVDAAANWEFSGRDVRARGTGKAGFRTGNSGIISRYFDGYPEGLVALLEEGRYHATDPVGDLRLEGTLRALAGTREVVLELSEGLRHYRFRLPGPSAAEDARPEIGVETDGAIGYPRGVARPNLALEQPWRLPADKDVSFAVQNLDDRIALEVDGEVLLAIDVASSADQTRSGIRIQVNSSAEGGVDFTDLMVYRDIFYRADNRSRVKIPEGHYYMLGDNTQDSSDGREWSFNRYRVNYDDPGLADTETGGKASKVVRVDGNGSQLNDRIFGFGDHDGAKHMLVDEWGERRIYRSEDVSRLTPEAQSFVPRAMMQGKALAVFWPILPWKDVHRFKWVH